MPTSRFNKLLHWWARWERHFSVASMVLGFSFDLIIAKRPDNVYDNILLLSYLLASATIIVLINLRARRASALPAAEPLLLLLLLQFCFGGLSSNLLILYGKSGTPAGNLVFIGLLFAILIGNEFLRTRYAQNRFNIAVYYLLLLTYSTIAVPTFILHSIGPIQFFASGALSLIIAALFLFILGNSTKIFRGKIGLRLLGESVGIIAGVYLVFNILYFGQLIPPVPLSLKDIGIYHFVAKSDTVGYVGIYEPTPWWDFWQTTSGVFTLATSSIAYCFSSVFAPTGLTTPIKHEWYYLDPATNQWVLRATITYPIVGGNSVGYKGFSEKGVTPGQWRCSVETAQNQIIGQATFTVATSTVSPMLLTREM
ncbi:MAG: DUF2914 domain-containing protein [Patescibacteria group bacterium]|nr:DUF2914 domain-containing protein [Patescibacteria group bacterium]